MSILKNLFYVDCDSHCKNDGQNRNTHKSSFHFKFGSDKLKIVDKKAESIKNKNSNMIKNDQTETKSKNRWYKREIDLQHREDIDFDQSESSEEKVSHKLSSMTRYAPNSKDYVYIISKAIRWLTLCK